MELKNWMKNLNGNSDLLRLNIPGTHDCVTKYVQFPHISKTQNLTIKQQLLLGIRALDIRVASRAEKLIMVHGKAKAFNSANKLKKPMDLEDVLNQCYEFLDENPTETIIFQFKNDSGTENELCFNNLINTYIRKHENRWFLKNKIPNLDEARGKIYLIRRCKMEKKPNFTDDNTGLDFSLWQEQDEAVPEPLTLKTGGKNSACFIIQDRYKYKPIPRWSECIKPFLDRAEPFGGTYIINYLSTAGGLKGPEKNAEYINPRFIKYPLKSGFYYGTIYCDFPSESLVKKIILTNFE
ncbi:MAG: phosphatidylinositol-specific phospholipase C domain-containing protein [Clostridiales bacterium]|nr:phosphatidylinositol-specific phospholipase C domain-containing protein [Clostridiales bacterium]